MPHPILPDEHLTKEILHLLTLFRRNHVDVLVHFHVHIHLYAHSVGHSQR